jgi:uncharacterized protein (TIGR02246 family)
MKQGRFSSARWMVAAALAALTVSTVGDPAAAQQAPDVRAAIEAASRDFMATFARGDAAGLARAYTRDALVMPANSDFLAGAPAIQALWQAVFGLGARQFILETLEVESCGDLANEVGKYTLRGKDDQVLDRGKYLVVWKREDGQWKIHRDIWTTSLPAAQP